MYKAPVPRWRPGYRPAPLCGRGIHCHRYGSTSIDTQTHELFAETSYHVEPEMDIRVNVFKVRTVLWQCTVSMAMHDQWQCMINGMHEVHLLCPIQAGRTELQSGVSETKHGAVQHVH